VHRLKTDTQDYKHVAIMHQSYFAFGAPFLNSYRNQMQR